MRKEFQNEITKNRKINFVRSFWTGRTSIYVDDIETEKVTKNQFLFDKPNEEPLVIHIEGNEFKGIELIIDHRRIIVLRKLVVYEYILSCFPLVMIFFGGAIGGGLAGLSFVLLINLMRVIDHVILKILAAIGISILTYYLWLIIASIIIASL